MPDTKSHRHTTVVVHVVQLREGVPYEVERKVCSACSRLLEEKPVRRAVAA